MNMQPDRLGRIGFKTCEHPIKECTPLSPGRSLIHKYCLTCGASIDGPQGWRGGFGNDHYINYNLIDKHQQRPMFDFWISQRPESRIFGDVS